MESEFNKKLVATILKHIPKNRKMVVYLINTLNISRESAYRRMRGDIPFTVQELITMATNLEFSIDEIYDQRRQNQTFELMGAGKSSTDFFIMMPKKYNDLLEKLDNTKKLETMMAFNTFPPPFYTNFSYLLKFAYCKWLNQDCGFFPSKSYSEIVLPSDALVFQSKMLENIMHGKNLVMILDMNIFLYLIKEIQYFYQRKLLTNEELLLLKKDILRLIEYYEKIAQTGTFGDSKIQLYLSSLYVNSNAVCYNQDGKVEPLSWIYTNNPVIIQNAGFASTQIKWLNSLRRQSSLITQSNEILQAEFFSRQQDYIDEYFTMDNAI